MKYSSGIILNFGRLIQNAENRVIEQMTDGRIEDEPALTARFFDSIESIFEESEFRSYTFRARTLRPQGGGSPERRHGADVCGVIHIDLPDFQLKKGFIMQAKWAERNRFSVARGIHHTPTFRMNDFYDELRDQCGHMLRISPDSFVILYSLRGFCIVPASSIVSVLKNKGTYRLWSKNVSAFFKEFLMSFIGDPRIKTWRDEQLDRLLAEYYFTHTLLFTVKEKPSDQETERKERKDINIQVRE